MTQIEHFCSKVRNGKEGSKFLWNSCSSGWASDTFCSKMWASRNWSIPPPQPLWPKPKVPSPAGYDRCQEVPQQMLFVHVSLTSNDLHCSVGFTLTACAFSGKHNSAMQMPGSLGFPEQSWWKPPLPLTLMF